MNKNTSFEQTNAIQKIKEISGLVLFIIASLLISIIMMNFLVMPIAQLSVKNPKIFTIITKYIILISILLLCIYFIVKKIIAFHKHDISAAYIIESILKFIVTLVFFIIITTLLLILIYWLLQQNYYLLYKIVN